MHPAKRAICSFLQKVKITVPYMAIFCSVLFIIMIMGGQAAYAAPALSIQVDQISPCDSDPPDCNNDPVNNCQDVTFRVTLTNTGVSSPADDAVNVAVTNTMPAGFTFQSKTADITSVPAGTSQTQDFTYTASCTAVSGDNSTTVSFEGPAGTTYPDLENLRPFTVNPGAITISKVATHVNGGAITETSEPDAAIGDTVTWKITVKSSGLGSVSNVEVTETLGSGLVFTDAATSPR
ncbi:MAG: hypothetical protein V2I97_15860, partial [Desulfococcaceae bacterium]|nr:hypothetical protein [Desulfococcaceae bacterium]